MTDWSTFDDDDEDGSPWAEDLDKNYRGGDRYEWDEGESDEDGPWAEDLDPTFRK